MSTLTGGRHVEFVWQYFPKTFEKNSTLESAEW